VTGTPAGDVRRAAHRQELHSMDVDIHTIKEGKIRPEGVVGVGSLEKRGFSKWG